MIASTTDRTSVKRTRPGGAVARATARLLAPAIALLFAGMAAASDDQLPGDAKKGEELSISVCGECHDIEMGGGLPGVHEATPFQVIADRTATTPLSLRVFLTQPHTNMPNLILSDEEIDDVIAYILSLR